MATVPMIAPDGSSGDIPRERADDAVKAGFKRAVVMHSPDGQQGYVPIDRAQEAINKGFKVGQSIQELDKPHENLGVADTIKGVAGKVGGLVKGVGGILEAGMSGNPLTAAAEMGIQSEVAARKAYKATPQDRYRTPIEPVAMASGAALGADTPALAEDIRRGDAGGAIVESTPLIAQAAAGPVTRGIVDVAGKIPTPRGMMAERMAQPVEPGGPTRAEVLDAARDKGVNLDVAQATDSGIAHAVKKANRYSIASQGTYDAATTKNVNALEQWANGETTKYSPDGGGREVVGPQLQEALKRNLATKKEIASQMFDDLDKKIGGAPNDVSGSVAAEAQKIIAENRDYYAKHPELKPGKAWAILEDLASKTPGKEVPKSVGGTEVIDAAGNPITQKGPAGGPKIATWQELHQLRSDLMDFYRNNPDIVKGRSEAWIQQMVSKVDEAMTNGTQGMTPENLADFRKANSVWESIKNTYDNPQSQYYHAVRTQTPSQVPAMLSRSPELVKSVRQTLGSLEGPFQRQFVENLINGKDGALDLKNLNSRLSRVPPDMLAAMIGEEGAKNLRMLGRVASKVMADANPSGTAKVGVPASEAAGLFTHTIPTVAELGTQYVGAKAINSPRFLDYLTKPTE